MVDKLGYKEHLKEIDLLLAEGPLSVKCENFSFVKRPWYEKVGLITSLAFSTLTENQRDELKSVFSLAHLKAMILTAAHKNIAIDSPFLATYFDAAPIITSWNNRKEGWQEWLIDRAGIKTELPKIDYSGSIEIDTKFRDHLTFSYINNKQYPLVITAKKKNFSFIDFQKLTKEYSSTFQKLLAVHKSILFRGFNIDNPFINMELKSIFGNDFVMEKENGEIWLIDKGFYDAVLINNPNAILRQRALLIGAIIASILFFY